MVKTITSKINDELYDEAVTKANAIGLNRSQLFRYAIAIVCGHDTRSAMIIAKVSPDVPFSTFAEGE